MGIGSFFSGLVNWFKKFFVAHRDGMDAFLTKIEPMAIAEMQSLFKANMGQPLHVWIDAAFAAVKDIAIKTLAADFPYIPDTWIAIAVNAAYEAIKSELAKV